MNMLLALAVLPGLSSSVEPVPPTLLEPTFSLQDPAEDSAEDPVEGAGRSTCISVYYSNLELGELEFEGGGAAATLEEAERQRIGVQVDFNRLFLRFYAEEAGDDELDGFGLGLGVRGAHGLSGAGGGVQVLLDYEIALDGSLLSEDTFDSDLFLLDLTAKLGPGIGVGSFVGSAGVAASFLFGEWDFPGIPGIDVDGTNVGFYVGAGLRPLELPIQARLDAHIGDVEGVVLTVGVAF